MLAIVVGVIMFAFLAADDVDVSGSGRALWGLIMAPFGVVMLIAGIIQRSRGPEQGLPRGAGREDDRSECA